MNNQDRIEDIEQKISIAYQEGHFEQARALEKQLKKLRGHHNLYDQNDPYSLEGRFYYDDHD
ncbi:hypothetical protein [Photobacterium lucens]|uniref:hypothetical protein n=1 Tax=Photobacterium lucens TaxID=2562949 RepID=UPI0006B45E51|nr:hypothetical protein [Photobacterium lucens]KPA51882.1 hypothetical protein VT25_17490 [Photobacterium leiognathi subsp. mandapamensis]MBP2701210.1 hypothetical protein [Vibrio parahaemolyticus]MZG55081.1 hypothetical protein [Photobacterium lucens]MZG79259.1 hypothetical protein [Photobacterium lucens]PSV20855.1 hypothetical protein C0W44_10000 [Photobacterium leiognathi subsp. mandapamensis]